MLLNRLQESAGQQPHVRSFHEPNLAGGGRHCRKWLQCIDPGPKQLPGKQRLTSFSSMVLLLLQMYIASVDHVDHPRIPLALLQKNEVLINLQFVEEEAGMWRIIGAWLRKSLHARDEAVQKLLLCLLKLNQAILGNLEGAGGQQQELTVRQAGGSCLSGGVLVHQGQLAEDGAAPCLADTLLQVALQGRRADTVQRPHSSRLFPGQWNVHILEACADGQSWGILIS
mmetsp:Transcript_36285/g.86823  ORF Transcript_36285/g.86823 Transcript_36285/m.86823 type:complete len:227 (+) Transcript_36285:340-1020(+)